MSAKSVGASAKTALSIETRLASLGRDPAAQHGMVNPPIYHASTVTFPNVAALEAATQQPFAGVYYGRFGTPTTFAFEEAVAALDGGYERSVAVSSGLAAISIALLSFLQAGDHLLMVDSVYGPTRAFCDSTLKSFGIETTYYDPHAGTDIGEFMQSNTKLVFCESPGSLSFEVQDVPAIAAVAHAHNALVLLDNTWATPLFFPAFERGVDICIHAATKYLVGHADAMLGVVTMRTAVQFETIKRTAMRLGNCPSPEACWLALRGLRSLSARLQQHQQSALLMAEWLAQRPEVQQVWYPALPDDPGYGLWSRDYTGASGLFAFVLRAKYRGQATKFLDNLSLFGLGYSWGGFESLALPVNAGMQRSLSKAPTEPVIRLHIGLESVDDLKADLDQAFKQINAD